MNELSFPLWPAILAAVAFVVMMGAGLVLAVQARRRHALGGWSRLRARFPVDGPPDDVRGIEHRTIQVGRVVLERCATVGVGRSGLYLEALWHRPALIPWDAIEEVAPATLHWQAAHRLTVGGDEPAAVTVKDELFRAMQPYLEAIPAREAELAAVR